MTSAVRKGCTAVHCHIKYLETKRRLSQDDHMEFSRVAHNHNHNFTFFSSFYCSVAFCQLIINNHDDDDDDDDQHRTTERDLPHALR